MLSNVKKKTTLGLFVFIVFLFLVYYTGISSYPFTYLRWLINPVLSVSSKLTYQISDFLSAYFIYPKIKADNQYLRESLVNLAVQRAEIDKLRQENQFLKKELAFQDEYGYKTVLARIIGRSVLADDNSFYLILNKGSLSGLKPGLAVTTHQGVIIGVLKKVQSNLSFVQLLTDRHSKISAVIKSQPGSLGLLRSSYNLNLKMELIPNQAKIEAGDLVTTSGLDNYIPAGLLIGRVYQVDSDHEKLWQQALVEPLLNYQQIQLVDIILPKH